MGWFFYPFNLVDPPCGAVVFPIYIFTIVYMELTQEDFSLVSDRAVWYNRKDGQGDVYRKIRSTRHFMKKIVMFDGEIETQQYFTYQMRKEFQRLGHEVYTFNLSKTSESLTGLMRFVERGNTALVCFNFHGITPGDIFLDEQDGSWFWDGIDCTCYNIVVDHPFYYHRFLDMAPKRYVHISIDRKHDAYMQKYFPEKLRIPFLPLAGTEYHPEGYLPVSERKTDIVFTGNYSAPHKFDKYIKRLGVEYEVFYRGILEELIAHPERTLEDVAEKHIRREIPEVTKEELKETMGNLIFLDLYVRSYVRGKAVQVLADAGLKVEVYGDGWDELECAHPENIIDGQGVNSETCLQKISGAKISLNVMPWFKDGAHDRVFNTLLNGALLLSDDSIYLREILKDGENCILYNLENIEQMPERVKAILADEEKMQQMIDRGYEMAKSAHTWAHRADFLSDLIEDGVMDGIWQ